MFKRLESEERSPDEERLLNKEEAKDSELKLNYDTLDLGSPTQRRQSRANVMEPSTEKYMNSGLRTSEINVSTFSPTRKGKKHLDRNFDTVTQIRRADNLTVEETIRGS